MKSELKTNLELKRLETIDDYRRTAPEILSTQGAARYLGISEKTLLDNLVALEIPCRKIGKNLVFSRESLVNWVKSS